MSGLLCGSVGATSDGGRHPFRWDSPHTGGRLHLGKAGGPSRQVGQTSVPPLASARPAVTPLVAGSGALGGPGQAHSYTPGPPHRPPRVQGWCACVVGLAWCGFSFLGGRLGGGVLLLRTSRPRESKVQGLPWRHLLVQVSGRSASASSRQQATDLANKPPCFRVAFDKMLTAESAWY